MRIFGIFLWICLNPLNVEAQGRETVLDFEADRIGGERSGPFQSFLQGSQGPSFDTLLYMRRDFVDFQKEEYQRRQTRSGGRVMTGRGPRERVLFRREAGDY